jgi:hypothetical protein
LMAKMVGQVRAKCPDTALVMAGYSYVAHPLDQRDLILTAS